MALRLPNLSPTSTLASAGQILILVASDGVRVPVKRAIATEASFVLRDLLDGQDVLPTVHHDDGRPGLGFIGDERPSPHVSSPKGSDAATKLENLFEVPDAATPATSGGAFPPPRPTQHEGGDANTLVAKAAAKAAVPDLMDFFPVAPAADPPLDISAEMPASVEATPLSNASPRFSAAPAYAVRATPTEQVQPLAQTTHSPSRPSPPPMLPPTEVEVPFPYFTGDILERVCRHMSYRFRMSSFGSEDGCYRVYAMKARTIPRPMTLPLVEYLDAKDRAFIADWDELITVQMVKAATLLNYEELLQLASAKLASYLIERDLEGVRTLLGVKGDFDLAEDAELKKEQVVDYLR
ncbi:hypothetical protein, conserved [Leishmania donovani]|uniref:SKP1-like protein n=1 Tax=Leishmania donovani TaxID=5661 RepID=A0A3S7X6K8_LEIDO|nr:hypothetical protein, conserved [Leishmania donovani]AYU82077.1 SKP1-like protein [Leishmania donovani]TPP53768.1 Skp1 family, dimerization domain protein [Leishmania donovani]CBZ37244.1 hypothetical protein, conserved [Leishmania donovani]